MSPPDSAQRYDFTGLTPNNYMDMDLSSIFGLNSRFGAVLGRIRARFRALGSVTFAEQLGLSKSNWRRLLVFLEDSAPALPVIFRSAVIVALGELRVCESGHGMM